MTRSDAPMQFVRLTDVACMMSTTECEMAKLLSCETFSDADKRRFADFVHGEQKQEVQS